jgi:hypothetical protein
MALRGWAMATARAATAERTAGAPAAPAPAHASLCSAVSRGRERRQAEAAGVSVWAAPGLNAGATLIAGVPGAGPGHAARASKVATRAPSPRSRISWAPSMR